jgi:hypothetical protein
MLLCLACNTRVNLLFFLGTDIVFSLYPFSCSFLLDKTIDVLLYVDRLDAYRVDNLDKLVAKAITDSFGKGIWNKAIVALTHAQFSPPDALAYDEFFSKRSESLLQIIKSGASLKKDDVQVFVYLTSILSLKNTSQF